MSISVGDLRVEWSKVGPQEPRSKYPSTTPTNYPTVSPSLKPSVASASPSYTTQKPSIRNPSASPSVSLSASPSVSLSASPSVSLSESPSVSLSESPSISLSASLTQEPSLSAAPTLTQNSTGNLDVLPLEKSIVNEGVKQHKGDFWRRSYIYAGAGAFGFLVLCVLFLFILKRRKNNRGGKGGDREANLSASSEGSNSDDAIQDDSYIQDDSFVQDDSYADSAFMDASMNAPSQSLSFSGGSSLDTQDLASLGKNENIISAISWSFSNIELSEPVKASRSADICM